MRTVTHVIRGGPVEFGRAVQFELAFADGSRETLRAGGGDLPKIVSELRGFASITERASRASRDRPVEVVNPYQVTDARTDRAGPMIVVRLPTTDGIPLLIAMDHSRRQADARPGAGTRARPAAIARPERTGIFHDRSRVCP